MKTKTVLIALPLLLAQLTTTSQAENSTKRPAHKGGCIELTTIAQQQKTITAADGSVTTKYVAASHVVPEAEVVWTTTARNLCAKPADSVVIDQPVPEHMIFVADSTSGADAQVTLSTDGHDYQAPKDLTVATDGVARHATAADVRDVRWTLSAPIAPQATITVRYRASVL